MHKNISKIKGLAADVERYVLDLLNKGLGEEMCYHTIEHTVYVVKGVDIIGRESGLTEDELIVARIAGWFHDTGYTVSLDEHERESVKIARNFLEEKKIDPVVIQQVEDCIMATRIPQSPNSEIAKVLCDADLRHLADDDYYRFVKLMRCEMKKIHGKKLSEVEFDRLSVDFFRKHHYHTDYGKKVLEEGKRKNLQKVLENIAGSET